MNYKKLETLSNLKKLGELSQEEFSKEKAKLETEKESPFKRGNILNIEENYFIMLLHLTQFCGLLIPIFGQIIPLLLWLQNKDYNEKVDIHGRIIFNWIFSFIIYFISSLILSSIVIGLFTLGILIILSVIFPIIGSLKAKKGKAWNYPLSIPFFNTKDKVTKTNSDLAASAEMLL
jgi:uncharacterized Tic20 family protein